jgi:hypothetical protein
MPHDTRLRTPAGRPRARALPVPNALCAPEEMAGANGRRSPGLPHERVAELMKVRGIAG